MEYDTGKIMSKVREYCEGEDVYFAICDTRPVVRALNEGGHNCTEVDLLDLLAWVKENQPHLLPTTGSQNG